MLYTWILLNFLVLTSGYKLEQVVILSRHNIRTPLMRNLEHFSPNSWPDWEKAEAGVLTEKGAKLEKYLAEYISGYLKKEKLLSGNCIDDVGSVFVYSNTRQRTRESAKAFVEGAFPKCNVTVHSINSDKMDPVFNPVIRNTSESFKNIITKEMETALDKLQLEDSYDLLEKILDLKNSPACKNDGICSFDVKDKIFYEIGEEPDLIGPLHQANAIVDSFLMSYYEGMPIEDVAWGKIKSDKKWKLLTKITKENQHIRFSLTNLAKEVAMPLIDYVKPIFEKGVPKFTLLHGHDSNLNSVLSAIGFKLYNLPDQYENTPVGGKLVFEKWSHENEDLLKVSFIYQKTSQLRQDIKLSDKNPPGWVELEISGCSKNENGFCLWKDFMEILRSI